MGGIARCWALYSCVDYSENMLMCDEWIGEHKKAGGLNSIFNGFWTGSKVCLLLCYCTWMVFKRDIKWGTGTEIMLKSLIEFLPMSTITCIVVLGGFFLLEMVSKTFSLN